MKHLYNTGVNSDHDAFDVKLHDSATLKLINGKGSITLTHPAKSPRSKRLATALLFSNAKAMYFLLQEVDDYLTMILTMIDDSKADDLKAKVSSIISEVQRNPKCYNLKEHTVMSIWHEIEAYGSCSGNSKISIQTLFKERFKDTDSTITYSQAPSSFWYWLYILFHCIH